MSSGASNFRRRQISGPPEREVGSAVARVFIVFIFMVAPCQASCPIVISSFALNHGRDETLQNNFKNRWFCHGGGGGISNGRCVFPNSGTPVGMVRTFGAGEGADGFGATWQMNWFRVFSPAFWHPCRGAGFVLIVDRWCRRVAPQPPATCCQASGLGCGVCLRAKGPQHPGLSSFAPAVLGKGENREWMRMGRRHRVGWMIDMV